MRLLPVILLLVVAAGLALGLVPMAEDEVIYDGPACFLGDTWSHQFALFSARPAGLYLAVAGVQGFRVFLNDSLLATIKPGNSPRTLLRALDLSDWVGLLRLAGNRLKLVATTEADSFSVRCWASPKSWYLGSSHTHTLYSDGALSVRDLLEWAERDGARFLGITDHNTLEQCSDTAFRRFGRCEPMRGTEWTTDSGHANLMGIRGRAAVPTQGAVAEMIDEAKFRGSLVHINHPCAPDHRWWRYPVLDPGIDGIELMNGRTGFTENEELAVAWWHSLLQAGHTIAGVGSSDFHGDNQYERPLRPCARVRASANHPDTLLRAFKFGRVMACDRPDGSRLYLYADTSGDGRWDLAMGDNIVLRGSARPVRFRVEAESVLAGEHLVVFGRSGELLRRRFDAPGDFEMEWSSLLCAQDSGFVRAQLQRTNFRFAVLTNPIYINSRGYELGPTRLRQQATARHVTGQRSGELEQDDGYVRLELKVENRDGYSPYEYGLALALDTAAWRVRAAQRQGGGVGVARRMRLPGYQVLTWQGGYEWGNRLRPGETVTFWAELRPRLPGEHRLLYRSWTTDRLFETSAEPDSGTVGPDGRYWAELLAGSELAELGAGRVGSAPQDGIEVRGATVSRGRVRLAVAPGGSGALELALYDRAGRCRLARRLDLTGSEQELEFEPRDADGRRLPAGVYFLRVGDGARTAARRLLVLN